MREDTPSAAEAVSLFEDVLKRGAALRVRATGKSMAPFLSGGEILTIKKVPGSSLKMGDVIFYRDGLGEPVVHRIVRIRNDCGGRVYSTRGDALICPDDQICDAQVLGKVCVVEKGSGRIDMESRARRSINYLIAVAHVCESWIYLCLRSLRDRFFRKTKVTT